MRTRLVVGGIALLLATLTTGCATFTHSQIKIPIELQDNRLVCACLQEDLRAQSHLESSVQIPLEKLTAQQQPEAIDNVNALVVGVMYNKETSTAPLLTMLENMHDHGKSAAVFLPWPSSEYQKEMNLYLERVKSGQHDLFAGIEEFGKKLNMFPGLRCVANMAAQYDYDVILMDYPTPFAFPGDLQSYVRSGEIPSDKKQREKYIDYVKLIPHKEFMACMIDKYLEKYPSTTAIVILTHDETIGVVRNLNHSAVMINF